MILDALDVVILDIIHTGGFTNYHSTDKYLDMVYLTAELYVSLKWKNKLTRNTSIFLFSYRTIGVILFEITQLRVVLFVFQNLFENFYLFYLASLKVVKRDIIKTKRSLLMVLIICLIPKIPQEYLLHYAQAQPWGWIKMHILAPLNIR
ncbi:MAG: hypothetical protein Q7S60_01510 [bacterium]|nr:hypothetical protein [bacterium]